MARVATGMASMRSVLMGAKVRRSMALQLSAEAEAGVARVRSILTEAKTKRDVALQLSAEVEAADLAGLQL